LIQLEVAPLLENIETQTLVVVDKLHERVHVGVGYCVRGRLPEKHPNMGHTCWQ